MKKISVAVFIDNGGGMMFYGKRQTKDRGLCAEFLESFKEKQIYVNSFSAVLFTDAKNVTVSEDPFAQAYDGCMVFVENLDIKPYLSEIFEFVIYRYAESYPYDKKFEIDLDKEGFKPEGFAELDGSSHEKIRKEIYRR